MADCRSRVCLVAVALMAALFAIRGAEPPAAALGGPVVGECPKAVAAVGQDGEGEQIEARGDSEWQRLTYPLDTLPPGDWQGNAAAYVEAMIPEGTPEGLSTFLAVPGGRAVIPPGVTWTHMGPMPLDNNAASSGYKYGIVTGRINAIAFASATTAYMGGPVGGVWKTTNFSTSSPGSTTWTPLWDAATFPAQSVGAITVDPNNASVVYVGTGDSQPVAGDGFGNGILKTTDGGATWTHYGAGVMAPYSSAGAPGSSCCAAAPDENIKVIAVDPRNSNTVIAGASYGLFISYDAGVTWTQYDVVPRSNPTYSSCAQRVTSLLLDGNTNPSTLYVALGYPYDSVRRPGLTGGANGVYRATVPTGGAPSFSAVLNSGWPAGTGNGTTSANIGRIELAWDASHTHIYAYAASYNNNTNPVGVYHTANGGTTWNALTGGTSWTGCDGDQAQDWYNLSLAVDPNSPLTLYIGRTNFWKGVVNAAYTSITTTNLSGVYGSSTCGYGTLHPDQHGFAFVPGASPTRFLIGNDGGVYFGTGAVGGFTQMNGTVNTMEFYAGQLGRDFANTSGSQIQYAFGGFQDNGSASWDSSNTTVQWQARGNGGDGFFGAFDPIAGTKTAGRWITEYTNGSLSCSSAGASGSYGSCSPGYGSGEREDWSTPFLIDQWNCTNASCGNMVLGSTVVWASTGAGASWTKTGSTDLTKGGTSPAADIICLDVAHSNPGSVLVGTNDGNVQWSSNVFTGTNCTYAASNTASFSCSANSAATWVNVTGGNAVLPNRAINGVAFDPVTNTTFYAAVGGFNPNTPSTPGHLFMGKCASSPCTGSNFTWTDKTGALPDVPFTAVAVNPNNPKQVFAGSYLGFYYTDDITQDPPYWARYMTGLPNTRVNFLAVDRGAAATPRTSTTLGAFTYGRGLYVTKINIPAACGAIPAAPSASATAPQANRIDVSWNDSATAGITQYFVSRSTVSGGPYALLATVADTSPGSGGGAPYTYHDDGVSGGTTYYYTIKSNDSGACTSPASSQASALATGPCLLAPAFAGASSVTNPAGTTCALTVAWSGASAACSGPVTYSVYRSTSTPVNVVPGNRIVAGLPAGTTSYADSYNLASGTRYYYLVRATDSSNGVTETNAAEKSGIPTGPASDGTWAAGAESSDPAMTLTSPWTTSATYKRTGNYSYSTGASYPNSVCTALVTPSLVLGTGSILSYYHLYSTETSYDGCRVEISTNGGSSWAALTPTPAYGGTITISGNACSWATGTACYIGTSTGYPTTWQTASVSLSAYSGQTVLLRWNFSTDSGGSGTGTNPGWYVDDIQVTHVQIPGSCATSSGPPGVPDGRVGTAMKGSKNDSAGSSISVTWDNGCASNQYELVYGTGGQLPTSPSGTYGLTGVQCPIGTGGPFSWNPAPAVPGGQSFLWWLVVARDASNTEGSWGQNSSQERVGPGTGGSSAGVAGACATGKSVANTCGQ